MSIIIPKSPSRSIFSRLRASLAALTGKPAHELSLREHSTQTLFALYRIASETHSREQALVALKQELERMLGMDVAFFMPQNEYISSQLIIPPDLQLNDEEQALLGRCWNEMKPGGITSASDKNSLWHFEPMISATGRIGIFGVKPKGGLIDGWSLQLLKDIAIQTAMILQHIRIKNTIEETRLFEEREKLRAMLLSSVSHDFKTPLAGIIGALSVYRSLGKQLSEQKRDALVETAIDEAQRLDNFITNILDMARLESGGVQMRKEWHDAEGMIENVVRRMQPRCRQHVVNVSPSPIGIEINIDILMTEQVLQNILDNACKYTMNGTHIEVKCRIDEEQGYLCEIHDFGPGIPPEKMHAIFDKFTRLHKKDTQVAGTGLGLAIAKAVMELQGGWISAANHPEGGAVFTLCIPQWRVSASVSERKIGEEKNVACK